MIDLFKIDKDLRYEYILTLCKPNQEPIQVLDDIYGLKYEARFPTTDEITFQIPHYILNNGVKEKNNLWDLVRGDYLIHCQRKYHNTIIDEKYFIITKPKEIDDEKEVKEVIAYSLEHELNKKIIMSYNFLSRKLHSITNELDDRGFHVGILNYISTLTSWSIGDIDAELLTKYRAFNITEKTVLGFLIDEVQKSFGCIFIFDTVNRKIHAKKIDNVGQNKGLYISEENYIKAIRKEIDNDEIVTRLYVYGRDNLSINEINPTGLSFVEDFSFYKTADYMSQDLIDALDDYEALVESKTGQFNSLLDNISSIEAQIDTKENQLTQLQIELAVIQDNIDVAIKNADSLTSLNAQKSNKETDISSKESEIATLENQISSIYDSIGILRNSIKKENNFTTEQLVELDFFERQRTWRDNSYIEAKDLWDEIPNILSKINQPPLTFEIDSIDFTGIVECQHDWKKLILGDIVNIEHSRFNFYIQVRLVGYTHDIDNHSLELIFSNRDSVDDPNQYISDLIKNAINTGTAVDYSRFKWDKSEENTSLINNIINSALDTSKNAVLAGKNQDVIINDRGISLTDITKPNEQMRIINNVLAMTNDNWATAGLAITPGKIYAEYLYGKIGAFAYITANQITVGDQGEKISDDIIDSAEYWNSIETDLLDGAIGDLEDIITDAFSDNYITNIEAQTLKTAMMNIYRESEDVCNVANFLNVNTSHVEVATNALMSLLFDNYINQESYPIEVTLQERNAITNAFMLLKQRIAELYNTIEQRRINDVVDYVDVQKQELDDAVKDLDTTITTAFSDSVITNIEAQTLKTAMWSVTQEAADVFSVAVSLNINTEDIEHSTGILYNLLTNNYIDQVSYPITVTAEQRQAILDAFADLESTIVALYEAIDAKQLDTVNTSLLSYVDGIETTLTGLIDGKIDTWFYAVTPTLTNPPTNSWTTDISKDKHLDDLYYNTANGYVYRFVYESNAYKWVRIKDTDIVAAMSAASAAQDTADGKRRVFVIEPIPPYEIGDLWRVTNVDGVDFKICITARATGSYNANDWVNVSKVKDYIDTQKQELDGAISDLDTTITTAFSDSVITNIEAQSLKTALGNMLEESEDVCNIADSLNISTSQVEGATNDFIDLLLDNYIDQASYPIEVTAQERNSITVAFMTLKQKIAELYNVIEQKRVTSAIDYTDSELGAFAEEVVGMYDDLEGLIDGKIDIWFYPYVPSFVNAPAVDWDTTYKKDKHLNDLFYNTLTGHCYRFAKENSVYKWEQIQDEDIIQALADASNAQDTADGKRRVFVSQPTTPYDVGDLWRKVTDGKLQPDLMICIESKSEDKEFSESDWVLATNAKEYIDAVDTTLREDLCLEAPLPTSINMGSDGIRASTTIENKYAQLDYRGLFISNGAIQINGANDKINYITGEYVDLGNAGLNNTGDEDGSIRIWAGKSYANRASAPFRINQKGELVATNADITGKITATSGSFSGVVNASDFKIDGISVLTNNKIDGDHLTNVTADSVSANWAYAGNISAGQITSGTLSANYISGGTISGVTINVDTNMTIGEDLILKTHQGTLLGIKFYRTYDSDIHSMAAMYYDAISETFRIDCPGKPIYANNYRLDQAPVAVFG